MSHNARAGTRPRGPRRRDRDSGQLMLLSGIVITLAFILTSLTLAQVDSLERQAATDRASALGEEWRFVHERLVQNFRVAVRSDLDNASFMGSTFPTISATFRIAEAEKGYDFVLRLANASNPVNSSEIELIPGYPASTSYDVWDLQGNRHFTGAWDGTNDGTLWMQPCPAAGGPAAGCIVGVYVYVRLSDGVSSVEELMLLSVNDA